MKWKTLVFVLMILVIIPTIHAQLTFQGTACKGDKLCSVITQCDFGGCQTRYRTCHSCPPTTITCPDGSIATCENSCQSFLFSSACSVCTPSCENVKMITIALPFDVYRPKKIMLTAEPLRQYATAGASVSYQLHLSNENPFQITLTPSVSVPSGWSYNHLSDVTIGSNQEKTIILNVTSSPSSSEGSYPISVIFSSNQGYTSSAMLVYEVSTHQDPYVTLMNSDQQGVPGEELTYELQIMNRDPLTFDPSIFIINAQGPDDWTIDIIPQSISIEPQNQSSVEIKVTSPSTASVDIYKINISVSIRNLTIKKQATYRIVMCGDNICNPGEEQTCPSDCDLGYFICTNGRCDETTIDGVNFAAELKNFLFTKFIVCSGDYDVADCISAYESDLCELDAACLCGNVETYCSIKCVDKTGTYYLYSRNVLGNEITTSKFTFECPYVDLQGLINIKQDLSDAKERYEASKSSFEERMLIEENLQEKASIQPCIDALGKIITNISDYLSYLDDVIQHPSVTNTQEARAKVVSLRSYLSALYSIYCQQATGLLVIDNVSIPHSVKEGLNDFSIKVKNIGKTGYYGYINCSFVSPSGADISITSDCRFIEGETDTSFQLSQEFYDIGDWRVQCYVYGSLDDSCSQTLHDSSDTISFNVFTKNAFIQQIEGFCDSEGKINASVVLSNDMDCVVCQVGSNPCIVLGNDNGVVNFMCPAPRPPGFYVPGFYNLTCNVYPTDVCEPTEESLQSFEVHCSGCGDLIVDNNEECEPPAKQNCSDCPQSENICNGKKRGVRSSYGDCTAQCTCSETGYLFSCIKGECGAECSDGEKRNVTKTTALGTCVCEQTCGPDCMFQDCYCENKNGTTFDSTCRININDISCNYNQVMNRYVIDVNATWSSEKGDHAHVFVDNGQSQRIYTNDIAYSTNVYENGTKSIKIEVHTDDEKFVCENSDYVSCYGGYQTPTNYTYTPPEPEAEESNPWLIIIILIIIILVGFLAYKKFYHAQATKPKRQPPHQLPF